MSSSSSTPTASPNRPASSLPPIASRSDDPQAGPSRPYPEYASYPSSSTVRPRTRHHAHPGCTLCSIVSAVSASDPHLPASGDNRYPGGTRGGGRSPSPTASTSFLASAPSPTSPVSLMTPLPHPKSVSPGGIVQVAGREIVFADNDVTMYKAQGKERLCAEGRHLIVVINRHLEGVYDLLPQSNSDNHLHHRMPRFKDRWLSPQGPADVPLLSHILDTCRHILSFAVASDPERAKEPNVRVGFVGSVIRDPQSSHKHLHAHAIVGDIDTSSPGAGFYRRNVIFGSMNWWSVEDLRAEIRESSSNNRVKSGYTDRSKAPIDRVPDAGARVGLPNAMDDDPYSDSPPPSARLHPDSALHRPPTDRKGKERADPLRLGIPRQPSKVSVSSNGSENGDEEGYVAVNLQDRT